MALITVRTIFVVKDNEPVGANFWCLDDGGNVYVSRATDYEHGEALGRMLCKGGLFTGAPMESDKDNLAKDVHNWLAYRRLAKPYGGYKEEKEDDKVSRR